MRIPVTPLVAMFSALNMVTHAHASITVCYECDVQLPPPKVLQPPSDLPRLESSLLILSPFQDSTGWNYVFSAPSQAVLVVMPYFADGNIFSVNSPDGWAYAEGVPDASGETTAVWQKVSASSTGSTIFSFKSSLSPAAATYQFSFDDGTVRSYQLFIPYSPGAQLAGYTSFFATVPEPSAIAMTMLGLLACVSVARRRKKVAAATAVH